MDIQDNIERLRRDNMPKIDKISHLEGQVAYLEDKLRNVESRCVESEKRELVIQSLKSRLDSSIYKSLVHCRSDCRENERELKTSREELSHMKTKFESAEKRINDLSEKVVDLKAQVREEILKNEIMDQKLDELDMLKDEMKVKDRKLVDFKADMEQKTIVLEHARLTLRQERNKVKDLKGQVDNSKKLREELALAQAEALTLKKLLIGKDSLLVQRSQALHLAKELIRELDPKGLSASSQKRIEQPPALYPQGVNFRDPDKRRCLKDGNMAQFENLQKHIVAAEGKSNKKKLPGAQNSGSSINGQDDRGGLLELILQEEPSEISSQMSSSRSHPHNDNLAHINNHDNSITAQKTKGIPYPNFYCPTQTFSNFRTEGERRGSAESFFKRPSSHQSYKENLKARPPPGRSAGVSGRPRTTVVKSTAWCESSKVKGSRPGSAGSMRSQSDSEETNVFEIDQMYIKFIHLGDRVIVGTMNKKGKEELYKGTVRYIGEVDKEVNDLRIYIGVKLDEPKGDTDGLYKGKRYFTCPEKNGKIMRITRVKAVLNQKGCTFTPIEECIDNYIKLGGMNGLSATDFKER